MNKENLEYRMYGLVPYNISPIQQGIQYGHAVVEYALEYGSDENYKKWAREDKTFIILNGGTTNTNPLALGTLNQHTQTIATLWSDYAIFLETDLGDQLTAVVFLVDERVWDKEKYPDLIEEIPEWLKSEVDGQEFEDINKERLEAMGGIKNWEFRQFLKPFKLA